MLGEVLYSQGTWSKPRTARAGGTDPQALVRYAARAIPRGQRLWLVGQRIITDGGVSYRSPSEEIDLIQAYATEQGLP